MDRLLRARLGAARLLLEEQNGKPSHAAISKVQAAAVRDLVSRASLNPEEQAEIAGMVAQLQWHGTDGVAILEGMTPKASKAPGRRKQQKWTAITGYFTDAVWDVLLSEEEPSASKLRIILDFCISLGLRCPTEPTSHILASLWTMVSEPKETIGRMQAGAKHALYEHLKSEFGKVKKLSHDPVEYVENLQPNPLHFLQNHKLLYDFCYKGDSPVPCRIDERMLLHFDQSYACRNDGRLPHKTERLQLTSPSTSGDSSSLVQLASLFMPLVETLQMGQQRMMDNFIGGDRLPSAQSISAALGSRRTPTRTLPEPRIELMPKRPREAGTMPLALEALEGGAALVRPSLPLTPTVSTLAVAAAETADGGASAAVGATEAIGDGAAQEVDAGVPTQAVDAGGAIQAVDAGGAVLSETADMLDMLDRREENKKNEAKQAKAAAKAAAKADAQAAAKVEEQPLPIKGAVKAKAEAAAKGKGRGKGKGKGRGKAVAASAKADQPAKPLLGCGKCRGAHGGCVQCRNPAYGGKRWQR